MMTGGKKDVEIFRNCCSSTVNSVGNLVDYQASQRHYQGSFDFGSVPVGTGTHC